jgi:hypothetical protein
MAGGRWPNSKMKPGKRLHPPEPRAEEPITATPEGFRQPDGKFVEQTREVQKETGKVMLSEREVIHQLAMYHCTDAEIAAVLKLSPEAFQQRKTADPRIAEWIRDGRSEGKASLRRTQFSLALKGDKTMLVWLGKQMLGQRDFNRFEISGPDGGPMEFQGTAKVVFQYPSNGRELPAAGEAVTVQGSIAPAKAPAAVDAGTSATPADQTGGVATAAGDSKAEPITPPGPAEGPTPPPNWEPEDEDHIVDEQTLIERMMAGIKKPGEE